MLYTPIKEKFFNLSRSIFKMPILANSQIATKSIESCFTRKFKAVATLIIAPLQLADSAVKMFVKTDEVDSLISLGFEDILNGDLYKYIPFYKVKKARKLYKNSKVRPGYLHRFILRSRPDIVQALQNIPETHKLICQIECPKKEITKYKNIDVGFTSNGKYEPRDKTLMGCAIRETFEEARLCLKENFFHAEFQTEQRKKWGMEDIPLTFTYSQTFCYVLVL
jgi:hypothetical protein